MKKKGLLYIELHLILSKKTKTSLFFCKWYNNFCLILYCALRIDITKEDKYHEQIQ